MVRNRVLCDSVVATLYILIDRPSKSIVIGPRVKDDDILGRNGSRQCENKQQFVHKEFFILGVCSTFVHAQTNQSFALERTSSTYAFNIICPTEYGSRRRAKSLFLRVATGKMQIRMLPHISPSESA